MTARIRIPEAPRAGRRLAAPALLVAALLWPATLLWPAAAKAHPHAWIDLRTTVILRDDGRISALEEEWLFDEFHTVYATESLGEHRHEKQALLGLARINLGNLKPYGYFTLLTVNGRETPLGAVGTFDSEMRGKRLWLKFTVPLAAPVDPRRQTVGFSIFDPSYYIEMLHQEGEPIFFRGPGADKCYGEIRAPRPTLQMVAKAAALDRGAKPDNSLGELFAQKVTVKCGSR